MLYIDRQDLLLTLSPVANLERLGKRLADVARTVFLAYANATKGIPQFVTSLINNNSGYLKSC